MKMFRSERAETDDQCLGNLLRYIYTLGMNMNMNMDMDIFRHRQHHTIPNFAPLSESM